MSKGKQEQYDINFHKVLYLTRRLESIKTTLSSDICFMQGSNIKARIDV